MANRKKWIFMMVTILVVVCALALFCACDSNDSTTPQPDTPKPDPDPTPSPEPEIVYQPLSIESSVAYDPELNHSDVSDKAYFSFTPKYTSKYKLSLNMLPVDEVKEVLFDGKPLPVVDKAFKDYEVVLRQNQTYKFDVTYLTPKSWTYMSVYASRDFEEITLQEKESYVVVVDKEVDDQLPNWYFGRKAETYATNNIDVCISAVYESVTYTHLKGIYWTAEVKKEPLHEDGLYTGRGRKIDVLRNTAKSYWFVFTQNSMPNGSTFTPSVTDIKELKSGDVEKVYLSRHEGMKLFKFVSIEEGYRIRIPQGILAMFLYGKDNYNVTGTEWRSLDSLVSEGSGDLIVGVHTGTSYLALWAYDYGTMEINVLD